MNFVKHNKLILSKILPEKLFLLTKKYWNNLYNSKKEDKRRIKLKNFKESFFINLQYNNIKNINFKLKIDPENGSLDQTLFLNKSYETHIVNEIIKNIKEGDTVLDIGANIGHHSILMSKCVGENGKVYSFEPIPKIIKQFKESIEINNIKNIEVKEFGLSDTEKELKFYINKNNVGHSSIINDGNDSEEIIIKTKTLDELNIEKFSFVKIDVEGYEWNVIQGGIKTILKYKPTVLIEWSPLFYRLNDASHSLKILNFFLENNYKLIDLENNNKQVTKENVFNYIKNFEPNLIGQTNLICTPKN